MQKAVLIFRFSIAFSFIVVAGFVIYKKEFLPYHDWQIYTIAALFMIYGLFRVYRAVKASDDIFIEK